MAQHSQGTDLERLNKERLANLLEAAHILNSTLEPEEVLESLMKLTNKLLDVEASSLLLLDQRKHRLFFKSAAGERAREVKHYTIPAHEGIVGWVVLNKKPYVSADVNTDPHWSRDIAKKIQYPTRSILCVPLMSRGKLIGALEVINKREGGEFDSTDISLLGALANSAAVALENARLHAELKKDSEKIIEDLRMEHPLIGSGPQMKQLKEIIRKVSPTDSTVLLRGDSGTGKELVAKTIHYNSPRSRKPFICVNCTLYSETLLESELFGHEQGAFTGAHKRRIGRFEQADGGMVFLDEVGSICPGAQLKLLRVLEDREFERLGGSETIRVDVRVIAATNEDLEKLLSMGRFREDLYYRLKVIEIFAPLLCERKEDIPHLVDYFIKVQSKQVGRAVTGVHPKAMELLMGYNWPGNVRELKNTIERAIVLGSGDTILSEHLPPDMRSTGHNKSPGLTLQDAERDRIVQVLMLTNGNKSKAARMLGVSRNRLDRKIDRYRIQLP